MKHPFTTTLSDWSYQFLNTQSKKQKSSRNAIIEKALKMYQKMLLKKQVKEGLLNRKDEYRQIANEFYEAQVISFLDNEPNL